MLRSAAVHNDRNIIRATNRFSTAGANGVELVLQYADALHDDHEDVAFATRPDRSAPAPTSMSSLPLKADYSVELELVGNAVRAIAFIEDRSQRIQAKALELTKRVKADRLETNQYISFLEQQVAAGEARTQELQMRLDEAETRVTMSCEWLNRFQQTIRSAFSALETPVG
jgi:hypothetical protein